MFEWHLYMHRASGNATAMGNATHAKNSLNCSWLNLFGLFYAIAKITELVQFRIFSSAISKYHCIIFLVSGIRLQIGSSTATRAHKYACENNLKFCCLPSAIFRLHTYTYTFSNGKYVGFFLLLPNSRSLTPFALTNRKTTLAHLSHTLH